MKLVKQDCPVHLFRYSITSSIKIHLGEKGRGIDINATVNASSTTVLQKPKHDLVKNVYFFFFFLKCNFSAFLRQYCLGCWWETFNIFICGFGPESRGIRGSKTYYFQYYIIFFWPLRA